MSSVAVAELEQVLDEVSGRIAARVKRAEVRRRVRVYMEGLLGRAERRNGWHLAEAAGERTPLRNAAPDCTGIMECRSGAG